MKFINDLLILFKKIKKIKKVFMCKIGSSIN